jgi:hypothetical protein
LLWPLTSVVKHAFTFFAESIAIAVFAIYWIIKSRELSKTEADDKVLFEGLKPPANVLEFGGMKYYLYFVKYSTHQQDVMGKSYPISDVVHILWIGLKYIYIIYIDSI